MYSPRAVWMSGSQTRSWSRAWDGGMGRTHIDWSAYIINTLRSQEMAQAGIELLPVWVSVTCYVYACQLYKIIHYFPFVVCVYSVCDNSFRVNFCTLLSQLSSILNFFFFSKFSDGLKIPDQEMSASTLYRMTFSFSLRCASIAVAWEPDESPKLICSGPGHLTRSGVGLEERYRFQICKGTCHTFR